MPILHEPSSLERNQYPFEKRRMTRHQWVAAEQMRETLLVRLRLEPAFPLPQQVSELLLKYTTVCHLNIGWYGKKREQEQRRYRWFLLVSLLVVVGTPALTAFMSMRLEADFIPLVTAIMAGALGAQQSLSSLFSERKMVGLFWRAEADLKADLYSFEDRWRGAVLETSARESKGEKGGVGPKAIKQDFMLDLKLRIHNAERIKREEQDAFFAQFGKPALDVSKILSSSRQQADSLLKAYKRSQPTSSETEALVESLRQGVCDLERKLGVRSGELEALEGKESSLARANRSALMSEISQLRSEKLKKELELSKELAALGRLES